MSYDLLVFAPEKAPKNREGVLLWWTKTAEWSENHSYEDPEVSTPKLKAWFLEMIESFPAMNRPYSFGEFPEDDFVVTDYNIGMDAVYASFAWSKAEAAYEHVFSFAAKHQVGFFDTSSDISAAWLPDGKGSLVLVHQGGVDGAGDCDA